MANEYNEKFDPDKRDFLLNGIRFNGNITQLAAHYNVSRETVYQYIKRDPDGKQILEQVRGFNNEHFLDLSEHVIQYNLLNYKNNPGLAQRAAEKVIDKKGHLRGWKNEENTNQSTYNIIVPNDLAIGTKFSASPVSDSDNQSAK